MCFERTLTRIITEQYRSRLNCRFRGIITHTHARDRVTFVYHYKSVCVCLICLYGCFKYYSQETNRIKKGVFIVPWISASRRFRPFLRTRKP